MAASIFAFIKSIPAIANLFNSLVDMEIERRVEAGLQDLRGIQSQRKAVLNAIKKADTNEDRNALSVTLSKLMHNE